jgi:hypothetical protein
MLGDLAPSVCPSARPSQQHPTDYRDAVASVDESHVGVRAAPDRLTALSRADLDLVVVLCERISLGRLRQEVVRNRGRSGGGGGGEAMLTLRRVVPAALWAQTGARL